MADAVIERLERRFQHLAEQQDDVEFLRQLKTYLTALATERPVKRILKGLKRESDDVLERFGARERELMSEAAAIRRRLAGAVPEIDNTRAPEPDFTSHTYSDWQLDSFASFDRLASRNLKASFSLLPSSDTSDKLPLATMMIILRGRLSAAASSAEDDPGVAEFGDRIHNLEERHRAALASFREQSRTLPGVAHARLQAVVNNLEPEPFLVDESEGDAAFAERAFQRALQQLGILGIMRSALGGHQLDAGERGILAEAIGFLRGEAKRLHEEVFQRLSRGEGNSWVRRLARVAGRMPIWFVKTIIAALIVAIVTLLVTAYFAEWFPGQAGPPTPPGSTATTTSR